MKIQSLFAFCMILLLCSCSKSAENVIIYPAPAGEPLSDVYQVKVQGLDVPVYNAKVGMERKANRERAMDDQPNSALFYDVAGFASFDLISGTANVEVQVNEPVNTVKVLPESAGIKPKVSGKKVSFEVEKPGQLTVEVNGEHIRSLHLFVNPEETDVPDPGDPNVIYFGPGIHDLAEGIEVKDNQTVYIAGGAILRWHDVENVDSNDRQQVRASRRASFVLSGKHSAIRGRGIIDQEGIYRLKARNVMSITGEDIFVEGVILRDASVWTVSLRGADNVVIDNIKLLGHRANSDGIDICDSWGVEVRNCFVRTLDDLVVVKTYNRPDGTGNVLVEKCVLWNEVAHALSIGAEVQQQVDGVIFRDCDIIGDHCREWSLRVYQCDKGIVKNITFEDIRIEEAVKFISLWINEATWSTDPERGHISDITFRNIDLKTAPTVKGIELLGFDKEHAIERVTVDNVIVAGKKVTRDDIVANPFVYDLEVK